MELVKFQRRDCFCPGILDVCRWLIGATVGIREVVMNEPTSFFSKLEELQGLVSLRDLSWVNQVCKAFLGREYHQPTFSMPKKAPAQVRVGVGANEVFEEDLKIEVKKMASWPAENPRRIYVDALVDGKEFHYYICKGGKQGRYAKGGNAASAPFSAMIPKEMEFLGVKSEQDVVSWCGVKGYFPAK